MADSGSSQRATVRRFGEPGEPLWLSKRRFRRKQVHLVVRGGIGVRFVPIWFSCPVAGPRPGVGRVLDESDTAAGRELADPPLESRPDLPGRPASSPGHERACAREAPPERA